MFVQFETCGRRGKAPLDFDEPESSEVLSIVLAIFVNIIKDKIELSKMLFMLFKEDELIN